MLKNKIKISKPKLIILIVASFVVLYTITSTTYAWLTSKTSILNSSFTYGDIKISINESENNEINYTMLPGKEIKKDPIVTVNKNSENCWLYIQIVKSDNFDNFMSYELEDNWKLLEGYEDIYYQKVDKSSKNQTFKIIKDDIIKVKSSLTKEDLTSLHEDGNYPTFSVTAYAMQRDNKIDTLSTATKAWLLTNEQE